MVHWCWIVAAFFGGLVVGALACLCAVCCTIAKTADEEDHDYFDHYVPPTTSR